LDVADDDDDEEDAESSGGRFWVWGDGEEGGLGEVKKSWEALEVSFIWSPYVPDRVQLIH
jgi:cell division control protein 45